MFRLSSRRPGIVCGPPDRDGKPVRGASIERWFAECNRIGLILVTSLAPFYRLAPDAFMLIR